MVLSAETMAIGSVATVSTSARSFAIEPPLWQKSAENVTMTTTCQIVVTQNVSPNASDDSVVTSPTLSP